MNDKELILELKRLSVRDSLQCFGCGHEHRCSTHGCAIIKQAVRRMEVLTAPEPNNPLTAEELQKMDGEPVWVHRPTGGFNAVICVQRDGRIFAFGARDGRGEHVDLDGWKELNVLKLYRRRPERIS